MVAIVWAQFLAQQNLCQDGENASLCPEVEFKNKVDSVHNMSYM